MVSETRHGLTLVLLVWNSSFYITPGYRSRLNDYYLKPHIANLTLIAYNLYYVLSHLDCQCHYGLVKEIKESK